MAFTPAIIQYLDIKKEHADCILFFRMGDFYETFFEDAKICSKVLDIVLTSKNKNSENYRIILKKSLCLYFKRKMQTKGLFYQY